MPKTCIGDLSGERIYYSSIVDCPPLVVRDIVERLIHSEDDVIDYRVQRIRTSKCSPMIAVQYEEFEAAEDKDNPKHAMQGQP